MVTFRRGEGSWAVREIVAAVGIDFVSSAKLRQDNRLAPIDVGAPKLLMDEAPICFRERSKGELVSECADVEMRHRDDIGITVPAARLPRLRHDRRFARRVRIDGSPIPAPCLIEHSCSAPAAR